MTPSKGTTPKSSTRTTSSTPQVSATLFSTISKDNNKNFTVLIREALAVSLSVRIKSILLLAKLAHGQTSTFMSTPP